MPDVTFRCRPVPTPMICIPWWHTADTPERSDPEGKEKKKEYEEEDEREDEGEVNKRNPVGREIKKKR